PSENVVAELEAQIVEQKLILDGLERKRRVTERELYATTYPVLTLPVEITTNIFIRCQCLPDPPLFPCPFDEDSTSMGHELRTMAPLILLEVCRVWRDIALDTPALWSTLNIRLNAFPNSVASEPGQWSNLACTEDHICAIVQRYSQRMSAPATFPLLHSTILWCAEGPDAVATGFNVFANAPRLRTLVMDSETTATLPLDIFTPPWSQLTKFNGIIKNLDLFALASNLTEAECFLTEHPEVSLTAVITHSQLQSIAIYGFSWHHPAAVFLQHLTLPALRSLNISVWESDNENPPSLVFESFLQQSRPPLTSLSFNVTEFTFHNWAKCLACVADTLKNLEIRSLPNEVLLNIFRSLDLPNLRTISLSSLRGRIDFDDLLRFLSNGGTPHLSSFRLVWQYSSFLDREMSHYDPSSQTSKFDSVRDHLAIEREREKQ
ncbi:hypothetical protein DFH09DRAFT_1178675, partial [Mycena vulgaris]